MGYQIKIKPFTKYRGVGHKEGCGRKPPANYRAGAAGCNGGFLRWERERILCLTTLFIPCFLDRFHGLFKALFLHLAGQSGRRELLSGFSGIILAASGNNPLRQVAAKIANKTRREDNPHPLEHFQSICAKIITIYPAPFAAAAIQGLLYASILTNDDAAAKR
jgi:hypothetical protein